MITHLHRNVTVVGFTLLEMVIVVSLMGIIASTAFVALNQRNDQERFNQTSLRYENIKNSIIGHWNQIPQKSFTSSGYITDVGDLPANLIYLFDKTGQTSTSEDDIPSWTRVGSNILDSEYIGGDDDGVSGNGAARKGIRIFSGWNGPYYNIFLDDTSLRDAWGWEWATVVEEVRDGAGNITTPGSILLPDNTNSPADQDTISDGLRFYSYGKDGLSGQLNANDDYENDFPASTELQTISDSSYKLQEIQLPEIKVENMDNDSNEHVFLGLIYPGIDLSDNIGDVLSDSAHPSLLLNNLSDTSQPRMPLIIPANRQLILGESQYRYRSDAASNAGELVDPAEYVSNPLLSPGIYDELTINSNVYFNQPLAYRYQIAFYRNPIDIGGTPASQTSLAQNLLIVYPKVYHFQPGTNNTSPTASEVPFKIPTQ